MLRRSHREERRSIRHEFSAHQLRDATGPTNHGFRGVEDRDKEKGAACRHQRHGPNDNEQTNRRRTVRTRRTAAMGVAGDDTRHDPFGTRFPTVHKWSSFDRVNHCGEYSSTSNILPTWQRGPRPETKISGGSSGQRSSESPHAAASASRSCSSNCRQQAIFCRRWQLASRPY